MPPSDPDKSFDLPAYLVQGIARGWGRADLSDTVRTKAKRPSLKNTEILFKLQKLEGTIEIDPKAFKDKVVLLVDDLYQAGVSMNYTAMLLLEAGARKVFGLACEKTCRNDDNVSEREKK